MNSSLETDIRISRRVLASHLEITWYYRKRHQIQATRERGRCREGPAGRRTPTATRTPRNWRQHWPGQPGGRCLAGVGALSVSWPIAAERRLDPGQWAVELAAPNSKESTKFVFGHGKTEIQRGPRAPPAPAPHTTFVPAVDALVIWRSLYGGGPGIVVNAIGVQRIMHKEKQYRLPW